MTKTVTFELEVEVDDEFLNNESDEEAIKAAESIMYTAPTFDGLSDDIIEEMTPVQVNHGDSCDDR